MPKIPDIKYDEITVTKKYTGGYQYERCKSGLWVIYNIIKKMASAGSDIKLLECLLNIGVNAKFTDDNMDTLIYTGKTNKKYKRPMPAVKYLFALENFGFAFTDLVMLKSDIPRNKLAVKDIVQYNFSYAGGDTLNDVIFGLKLFSDICLTQTGDCFYTGDIRVAFENAPKLYAPPVDEVFYFLPAEQKDAAYAVHDKLEKIGCIRNLEREYMTRYKHPKYKNRTFATIYASEQLYFLPDFEQNRKLAFQLNLRNIGKYSDYLAECAESVRDAVINTTDCYGCSKACGGVKFKYNNTNYAKCPWYVFKFNDLSKKAIDNYIRLIELEDNELK
jgi:hypothetical protein